MEELKPAIGLLDFQARNGTLETMFSNQNRGFKPFKEQKPVRSQLNNDFDHTSKHVHGSSSKVKICNLDELMSSCSLMYVSGDSQGLDSTKLQLEVCKNSCCNSRVKYARVHRDRDQESIWSSNRFTSLAPLNTAAARSSWDLGSDGASTPGSNSWGDALGESSGQPKLNLFGAVGGMTSGWPQQLGDFGFSSNQVFLDGVHGDNTWASVDALLTETDKAFGNCPDDASDYSDSWSQFQNRKIRQPQL